jgi:hydroxypyruvate isomerase
VTGPTGSDRSHEIRPLRALHRYAPNISLLFAELPVLERPAAVAAAGFDALELWWPFDRPDPAARDVTALARAVHDAGLQVACLNLDSGDRTAGARGLVSRPPDLARFRTNLPATVRLAGELGCRILHAPFGNRLPSITWASQRQHAIEQLAVAARTAAQVGATVVVEAQNPVDAPTYPLRTTAQAVEIASAASERADVPVRITYDAYHMLQTEGDLLATVRANLGAIGHVQVAGVPGRVAPGRRSPAAALLRELADLGYEGAVGLEYHASEPPTASFDWLAEPIAGQPRPT